MVFSGINNGYNVGIDILYSGTVGAAMEALVNGIPAIAFSNRTNDDMRISDRYLLPVARRLLEREISGCEIWNVNFPDGDPQKVRGILEDRFPAGNSFYETIYTPAGPARNGKTELLLSSKAAVRAQEGSDMRAVLDGYISIGKVKNALLGSRPGTAAGQSEETEAAE